MFGQQTRWDELDEALGKIHSRKSHLLLVLDHPELPLHNNLSEHDIRQYVKKRKISAGTRSASGRRVRDTFLSLKTTCRKLGQSFWSYLRDRLRGLDDIPSLWELIKAKANATAAQIDCNAISAIRLIAPSGDHTVFEKSHIFRRAGIVQA